MQTKPPLPTRYQYSAVAGSEDDPDDEAAIAPADHRAHERWDAQTKERAAALLFGGRSLRATARALGVPYATLRDWKLSADPVAAEMRRKKIAEIIDESWEASLEMIAKLRTAPVRSVQEAAVAYGILVERAIMAEARATVVNGASEKKTMADLFQEYAKYQKEQQKLKATALPRPPLTPPQTG